MPQPLTGDSLANNAGLPWAAMQMDDCPLPQRAVGLDIAQVCPGEGGRIYGEARHEDYAYPPPPLFSAAGVFRHLEHAAFATWLYMVTQIPTEKAEFPTRMTQIPTRSMMEG